MLEIKKINETTRIPAMEILKAAQHDRTTDQYIALTVKRRGEEYAAMLFIGGMAFPLGEMHGFWTSSDQYGQIHVPDPGVGVGEFPFGLFVDTEDAGHLFMCTEDYLGKTVFSFASEFMIYAKHRRYCFLLTASPAQSFHFAYTDEPMLQKTFETFVPPVQKIRFEKIAEAFEVSREVMEDE